MTKLDLKEFTPDDETIEIDGEQFTLTIDIPARALASIESLQESASMTNLINVVKHFLVKNDAVKVDALLNRVSVAGLTKLMKFLSEWFSEKMKSESDKKKD